MPDTVSELARRLEYAGIRLGAEHRGGAVAQRLRTGAHPGA